MNQDPSETLTLVTTLSIVGLTAAVYLAYQVHEYIEHRRTGPTTPSVPSVPPGATEHPILAVGRPDVAYKNYSLLITRCNDPLMWYADKVGQEVLYLGTWKDDGLHKSREPMGFVNIVRPGDATIIRRDPK